MIEHYGLPVVGFGVVNKSECDVRLMLADSGHGFGTAPSGERYNFTVQMGATEALVWVDSAMFTIPRGMAL
jgi:hypothetical protein